LEYAVARRAEEQARSSHAMAVSAHRLNLLAAFFFPLATLAAVFGMNLPHGLENVSPPIPFLATLGVGLVMGLFLRGLVTADRAAPAPRKVAER
jgi:Mg2+ and Co2+ transporter CorA